MKVIKTNAISSITASSADAGHPVTNLLNDSPKKKWTAADATVSLATVNIDVSGQTDAIGIVGVAAESISILISDPNGIVWDNVVFINVTWNDSPDAVDVTYIITDEEQGTYNAWVDFTEFTAAVTIAIQFRKTAGTPLILAAGVVVVGDAEEFNSPRFGLNEGLEDYSLFRILSNGATYYKARDRVRKFIGTIDLDRDQDFYRFMHNVARTYGSLPLMWLLTNNLGNKWVVYGRFTTMPNGAHNQLTYSEISFDITEVL